VTQCNFTKSRALSLSQTRRVPSQAPGYVATRSPYCTVQPLKRLMTVSYLTHATNYAPHFSYLLQAITVVQSLVPSRTDFIWIFSLTSILEIKFVNYADDFHSMLFGRVSRSDYR